MNPPSAPKRTTSPSTYLWPGLLLLWFLLLALLPDPRPLSAPEPLVHLLQTLLKYSHQEAAILTTVGLRSAGIALIGILTSQSLRRVPLKISLPAALCGAPVLAILALWINYAYFPIRMQLTIALISALSGVLLGFALRKLRGALVALIALVCGTFAWGTSTGISDDFYEITHATGLHILEVADEVPAGDAGFVQLMEIAFTVAADNSHHHDPVEANRAAILALGVILGEEKVATVAKREVSLAGIEAAQKLRQRITIYGRNDLPRHFWVSAGLALLSNSSTSINIGITKELMDSAGGSGFSFVDLTADRAGTLFFEAATRNEEAARRMQERILGGTTLADFIPPCTDLPEGIPSETFKSEYGGLGGKKTNRIVADILQRLNTCRALQ